MQPKDMAKKKFKLIPGADYEGGPVSKYGTFGNMLRTRMVTGLKKSADSIPTKIEDVSGENIEQVTDFINPGAFVGSIIGRTGMEALNKINPKMPDTEQVFDFVRRAKDGEDPKALYNEFGLYLDEGEPKMIHTDNKDLIDVSDLTPGRGKDQALMDAIFGTKAPAGKTSKPITEAINNPELFEMYPELKGGFVKRGTKEDYGDLGGALTYSEAGPIINIGPRADGSAVQHELQHAIDDLEYWHSGSAPGAYEDIGHIADSFKHHLSFTNQPTMSFNTEQVMRQSIREGKNMLPMLEKLHPGIVADWPGGSKGLTDDLFSLSDKSLYMRSKGERNARKSQELMGDAKARTEFIPNMFGSKDPVDMRYAGKPLSPRAREMLDMMVGPTMSDEIY